MNGLEAPDLGSKYLRRARRRSRAAPAGRPGREAQRVHAGHVPRSQARRDLGRPPTRARRGVPHRHRRLVRRRRRPRRVRRRPRGARGGVGRHRPLPVPSHRAVPQALGGQDQRRLHRRRARSRDALRRDDRVRPGALPGARAAARPARPAHVGAPRRRRRARPGALPLLHRRRDRRRRRGRDGPGGRSRAPRRARRPHRRGSSSRSAAPVRSRAPRSSATSTPSSGRATSPCSWSPGSRPRSPRAWAPSSRNELPYGHVRDHDHDHDRHARHRRDRCRDRRRRPAPSARRHDRAARARRGARALGALLPRPGPHRGRAARVRGDLRSRRPVSAHQDVRRHRDVVDHRGHRRQPARRRRLAHRRHVGGRAARVRGAQRQGHPRARRRHDLVEPVRRVRRVVARHAGPVLPVVRASPLRRRFPRARVAHHESGRRRADHGRVPAGRAPAGAHAPRHRSARPVRVGPVHGQDRRHAARRERRAARVPRPSRRGPELLRALALDARATSRSGTKRAPTTARCRITSPRTASCDGARSTADVRTSRPGA